MPQNGHLAGITLEADEVEHECVDDLVGESVLLIKKYSDEDRVGPWGCLGSAREGLMGELIAELTSVIHVGELQEGSSRMQDRDRDLGEDRTDDGGLAKSAGSALQCKKRVSESSTL